MHDFVVAKLLELPREFPSRRAYWRSIHNATRIPVKTLEKIGRRQIVDPGVSGIEKLADHFGYTPRRANAQACSPKRQPRRAAEA